MRRFVSLVLGLLSVPAVVLASPVGYVQTNLVSDGTVPAAVQDSNLENPWGIAFGPTTPFQIADNGSGLSTAYAGDGTKQSLVISVPPAPGSPSGTLGAPTGTVFNPTSANFMGDRFLFATEQGTIAGWQPPLGTTGAVRVDNSVSGAVYKGLAIVGGRIYATDFNGGKVDVWDSNYSAVSLGGGAFLDPNLPSGFAPFGIQNIGGTLFVTYAQKQSSGTGDVPGPGFGIVDKYDANGVLLQRLVVGVPGDPTSPLNSPWGIALAPATFGDFSGSLLVGNSGDGKINAFDPVTGALIGTLDDVNGMPIVIDRLWALAFGNAGPGFHPDALYFTAGLANETGGLFGRLDPAASGTVPEPASGLLVGLGLGATALLRRRAGDGPWRRGRS